MFLYLLTLHSEQTTSTNSVYPLPGQQWDRPMPVSTRWGIETNPAPGKLFVGTQEQQNLQLRSQPSVNDRDKWDVHGYRFVKTEHDIDPANLEAALNTYYGEIVLMSVPNCTAATKVKVSKFTFSGDEISKEMTYVFGEGNGLVLNSPLAGQGTFNSPFTECHLTNDRLNSVVEYTKSYISMMSMREKILAPSKPAELEVEAMAASGAAMSNISNNAIFREEVATYEGPEATATAAAATGDATTLKEKLVFLKWQDANDIKCSVPQHAQKTPGVSTSMLDVVFGFLKPKKTIGPWENVEGEKETGDKELFLMPCALTKYLGTEFCPEFSVEAPFEVSGALALQTLYKAMTGAVPKFSRDMLEKALEAVPVPAPISADVEGEKAGEGEEEESEETDTRIKKVDDLCVEITLEKDDEARLTKINELHKYCKASIIGSDIPATKKALILKQVAGLRAWLANDANKAGKAVPKELLQSIGEKEVNPKLNEATVEVEATTVEAEAKAKKLEEARAKLREVNENIKKMRALQEKLNDKTLSADEILKVQKEIVAEGVRQCKAAQLRRDPNEEVLENLWSFFRPEMLSTYKKSECWMEMNSNRQMWMIRAMWLQFALSPKTTYFSKIDAYGATYFGKKPLPDEYLSLATLKLANEKFDEYIELYKKQIGADEGVQLTPNFQMLGPLGSLYAWKDPKATSIDMKVIRAYILFSCLPNSLSADEKEIIVRVFAKNRTKADEGATVGSQQMYNDFMSWMTGDLNLSADQVKAAKSVFPIGELSNYMKQAGYTMTRRSTGMVYLKTQLVAETTEMKLRNADNFKDLSTGSLLPGLDMADPLVMGDSPFAAYNA